jgi:DNA-binding NarL/FixJ family response regulator
LGADEYLLKDLSREQLIDAILRVHARQPVLSDSLFARIQSLMHRNATGAEDGLPLTTREAQVLRHIALGLSNREIGTSLGISVETVKEHVQNLLRKLDATDRTQAAVWAIRSQLV